MLNRPKESDSAAGAERLAELRAKHPRFVYESFSVERSANAMPQAMKVQFHFRMEPEIRFAPETTVYGVDWERVDALPKEMLDNLLFHLGLIETLSYWKAACSPEIRVEAGALDSEQTAWFLDLLRHGMGEFFYVNRIDYRPPEFVKIGSFGSFRSFRSFSRFGSFGSQGSGEEKRKTAEPLHRFAQDDNQGNKSQADLVLTSGGKDSVVTLELLREAGRRFDCLLLNPTEAALAVARQAGREKPVIVRRTMDPRLLELNAAGYLNGHTPFSALLAVLGVLVATLFGHRRVIVSNERSAEEAGAEYLGEPVNHQYSKSFRFETLLREYSRTYLAPDVEYFSVLRPLYELQIASLFAGHPRYFPLFRSCNRGMKSNTWCGRCSKCLFVYAVLYPFLERERMLAIFGGDLLAWEGAAEVLRAMLGLDGDKPFECVGTREETLAAIYLCVEKIKQQGMPLPAALRGIEETLLSPRSDLAELSRRVLTAWTEEHYLPQALAHLLHHKIMRSENC